MREMLGEGLYHKEWENIYKNREILRKIHTMSNMLSHLSSFGNHLQRNTLLGKICVMITKGKDNIVFQHGVNESMIIGV